MDSPIIIGPESVIFPLSLGKLFNFSQVFVPLLLNKPSQIDKVDGIPSVNKILIHHAQVVFDLSGSLLNEWLFGSSLLFFEASNEHGFSSILCTCNQHVQYIFL